MKLRTLALSALAALSVFGPAEAGKVSSGYSKLDLNKCRYLGNSGEPEDGGSWVCEGYGGSRVLVGEGDGRFFIAYGPNATMPMTYAETLINFHTIGETMEWRLEMVKGKWKPFATILRYHIESDNIKSQELVVSKLGKDRSCFVATIDAFANKNANALAREAADRLVAGFRCGIDKSRRYGRVKGPTQIGQ